MTGLSKAAVWVGLICTVYCIVTGLYLAVNWVDPLANASPEEIAKHTHARGAGLVVFLIRIWPYFLIVAGGFVAHTHVIVLRRLYRAGWLHRYRISPIARLRLANSFLGPS